MYILHGGNNNQYHELKVVTSKIRVGLELARPPPPNFLIHPVAIRLNYPNNCAQLLLLILFAHEPYFNTLNSYII